MPLPSTKRFYIVKDPNRRGIDGKPSRIAEVMYKPNPNDIAKEFAHIWEIKGWGEGLDGKWAFNRSDVCFAYSWWSDGRNFNSMDDILDYLENNFHEKPFNMPE